MAWTREYFPSVSRTLELSAFLPGVVAVARIFERSLTVLMDPSSLRNEDLAAYMLTRKAILSESQQSSLRESVIVKSFINKVKESIGFIASGGRFEDITASIAGLSLHNFKLPDTFMSPKMRVTQDGRTTMMLPTEILGELRDSMTNSVTETPVVTTEDSDDEGPCGYNLLVDLDEDVH